MSGISRGAYLLFPFNCTLLRRDATPFFQSHRVITETITHIMFAVFSVPTKPVFRASAVVLMDRVKAALSV